ncbi:MAG: FAD-dependent oxidoreductase, partial [Pseudomonadales bacterium]|nr:FAD-dependent oxidoreductase [Pseudomonadales bacterium]
ARKLAEKGASVILLEKGVCAAESSWAGGGILSPLYPWKYPEPVQQLSATSRLMYPLLCEALLQETGIDPEYRKTGLVLTGGQLSEARSWCETHAEQYVSGFYGSMLDGLPAAGLYETQQGKPCLFMPEVAQVRNPRLTRALLASLAANGRVVVHQHSPVRSYREAANHVSIVTDRGERYCAGKVVFCAGAWTGLLLKAALPVRVEPVKGQMLLYRLPVGRFEHMLLHNGRYVIPRKDGLVLVGSTVEHAGFDKRVTEIALRELQAFAQCVSGLFTPAALIKQWAGLRPGTDDGIPFIGALPDSRRVFACAGHYRNGVVTAPASVEKLISILLPDGHCA